MEIEFVVNPNGRQRRLAEALATGIRRHGDTAYVTAGPAQKTGAHHVCCWGWRKGSVLRAAGREVLVMENGYLGDRTLWTSLGWNGLNNHGLHPVIDDGGARWREYHPVPLVERDPRYTRDYCVILGQVPTDMSVRGYPLKTWYREAMERLTKLYHRPVYFRRHPVAVARGVERFRGGTGYWGMKLATGDLREVLSNAWAVAGFNSNSLVDAALAGVPFISGNSGTMAWDVGGQTLEDEARLGDREQWVHMLAWKQWLPEEFESGLAWEHVKNLLTK